MVPHALGQHVGQTRKQGGLKQVNERKGAKTDLELHCLTQYGHEDLWLSKLIKINLKIQFFNPTSHVSNT